ncbi:MAG TPA: serine hydrolase domain-containing protein [Bacteroidia bacterium]|jgi:serine beta-lactamase-like protein LACTB|nr:serine hydrolase domain-containing protein [Bacteroidia bacterium]
MKLKVVVLVFVFGMSNAQNKQIQQSVNKLVSSYITVANIPGISVCAAIDNKTVYSNSFGFSDINNKTPITDSTRYRIGSLTKVLTAAAFAKLIEKGDLKEDDFIARYVTVPQNLQIIRLGQLASHTSGIRHYGTNEISSQNDATHKKLEDALSRFINDSLVSKPGEKYKYSSYGYILLGAAIENQQKKSFNRIIDTFILSPLNMKHTCPEIYGQKITNRSMFYYPSKTGFTIASGEDYSYKWPAGGYLSTPNDLVTFGSGLLSEKVVSKNYLSLLFTSQKTNDGKETGAGYGFKIGVDSKGRKVIFHGGESEGARAFLLIYPEEKLVISLCANAFRAPISEGEAETIAGYFLNDYVVEKNPLTSRPYKFMTKNDGRDIEGDIIVDGKKGIITGLTRMEIPILDIVKDKNEIRIIALSNTGIINIWLTPDKDGYKGKWGYDKPTTEIKML